MKRSRRVRICTALAACALSLAQIPVAQAQSTTQTPNGAAGALSPVSDKAERKAARKQARAKKNAELKKLEDAGYATGKGNDPNYPQDLQNAQKKAGVGQ
ncbi:DUF4148 domain-containing protein [Caballeronia sp. AZ7_KS35]|uniref:DUF4148 domain-containing protein n=1 Tax=Caballeronia sp. AZ7_KS35 TaxID=2921762 RepID=UPI002029418C|nr:DUF4148 domain-containing protein [Caballeronia sp. AZ7_KS35]